VGEEGEGEVIEVRDGDVGMVVKLVGDGGEVEVEPLEDVGARGEGAVGRRERFLESEAGGGGVGMLDDGPSGAGQDVVGGRAEDLQHAFARGVGRDRSRRSPARRGRFPAHPPPPFPCAQLPRRPSPLDLPYHHPQPHPRQRAHRHAPRLRHALRSGPVRSRPLA